MVVPRSAETIPDIASDKWKSSEQTCYVESEMRMLYSSLLLPGAPMIANISVIRSAISQTEEVVVSSGESVKEILELES
jgi:hypothetical protein